MRFFKLIYLFYFNIIYQSLFFKNFLFISIISYFKYSWIYFVESFIKFIIILFKFPFRIACVSIIKAKLVNVFLLSICYWQFFSCFFLRLDVKTKKLKIILKKGSFKNINIFVYLYMNLNVCCICVCIIFIYFLQFVYVFL